MWRRDAATLPGTGPHPTRTCHQRFIPDSSPPGWDRWYAWEGAYPSATTYDINENGRIVTYQRSEIHDTDLHAQTAESFIRQTAGVREMRFTQVARR